MNYKEATKYSIITLVVVALIGLIIQIFVKGSFGFGSGVEASHDFGRLNSARFFLMAWETFWLSVIVIFFVYVSRRATTGKSEDQINNLEDFEPLLFKIIITGLVIAAILTLIVPIFVGDNSLAQFNQNNTGIEVNVVARQFQFEIEDQLCKISDTPDASCATFQTGQRYIFILTSKDTTHGFTIYDSHHVLLMQAQIVPGYATRLAFTFQEAGDYSIRCAEYCGAGHHGMLAAFTVEASQ